MKFLSHTLPNGLQIIAEQNPHALSAAVGAFVRAGSRDETPELAGVSHFLEHMAFKGSDRRTAEDVNREFDEIGAKYNAYTTEEHTVYHAAVLPEYLPQAVDLICDLLRPTLRTEDFEVERKVILDEISRYADSPIWTAYDQAMRLHFLDHPLGNSVLGTDATVSSLTPEVMKHYHQARYRAGNIFIAAAGNVDWDHLVELISLRCGNWPRLTAAREIQRSHQCGRNRLVHTDNFVQECLYLLMDAPAADHPLRFAAEVLANIVGDDSGSRFHWELIDPGNVESADFGYHEYEGLGMYMASLNCDPELVEENLDIVRRIFADVTTNGVTEEEVQQAKNKIGSRIVLAAERPQNRLYSLGYNWSYRNEYRTVSADLKDLNAVTVAQIQELLDAFPLAHPTTVALGPLAELANLDDAPSATPAVK